jgi:hypothetical protein
MIASVDDGYVDRLTGQPLGGLEAAKSGADNHHAGTSGH